MSDEYSWDRSGPPDEFAVELERTLAPLGAEADALIDDLLGEVEREAVVVLLPRLAVPEVAVTPPPSRWIWLSAAAALLLTTSTLVLVAATRHRLERPLQVGGDVEPLARVRVGVRSLASDVDADEWAALVELRTLHRPLAECARARESSRADELEPVELELSTTLRPGETAMPGLVQVRQGALDEPTRACVTRAVSEWRPHSLGAGELILVVEIEAES